MKLSQKQSDAWYLLEHNKITELLYGGAAGGGKSTLGCLWHIYRRTKYPGSRGLIGRAKIARLEESTLVTLFEVASRLGYRQGVDFKYNQQKHTIQWANGSLTLLKDLFYYPSDPDFTALGSTEFTDAFIDEAPEITRKAKQIVSSRLRWKIKEFGIAPTLLMTCNPTPGWVKEDFVMDDDGNPVKLKPNQAYIHSTLDDNPDEHFRELYGKQLEALSDYDRARLRFGDWNVREDVLNPFAFNFDPARHIGRTGLMDKQLHLSIDFNLNPFCVIAFHIWRDNEGEHMHVVDEISIENGSVNKMIDEIKARYGKYVPNIRITGDYNGHKREISQQDNASNYLLLQRGLRIRENQIVTPVNPTHDNSRTDCNYFLHSFPDFKISDKCKGLIFDLQNVECDAFGQIIKKSRTDLTQQADRLDCLRYAINAFMIPWIERHQKTHGYRK